MARTLHNGVVQTHCEGCHAIVGGQLDGVISCAKCGSLCDELGRLIGGGEFKVPDATETASSASQRGHAVSRGGGTRRKARKRLPAPLTGRCPECEKLHPCSVTICTCGAQVERVRERRSRRKKPNAKRRAFPQLRVEEKMLHEARALGINPAVLRDLIAAEIVRRKSRAA